MGVSKRRYILAEKRANAKSLGQKNPMRDHGTVKRPTLLERR